MELSLIEQEDKAFMPHSELSLDVGHETYLQQWGYEYLGPEKVTWAVHPHLLCRILKAELLSWKQRCRHVFLVSQYILKRIKNLTDGGGLHSTEYERYFVLLLCPLFPVRWPVTAFTLYENDPLY